MSEAKITIGRTETGDVRVVMITAEATTSLVLNAHGAKWMATELLRAAGVDVREAPRTDSAPTDLRDTEGRWRMMPWQEEWEQTTGLEQTVIKTREGEWVARFSPSPGVCPDHELARAKLAAAAPSMARFLRALYAQSGSEEIEAELVRAGVPIPKDPNG